MSTRHRIAIFVPTMDGGGAEKAMLNLARGLVEAGESVDLVLRRAVGTYMSAIDKRVRVIDLDSSRLLWSIPGLARYIRTERPLVLLSTMAFTNVAALSALKLSGTSGVRLIFNEQVNLSEWVRTTRSPKHKMLPHLIRATYPRAHRIVAASRGVADDLETMVGHSASIEVIPNPLVTAEVAQLASEQPKHRWLEDRRIPVVLSVGRLTQQKDFKTLILAFAKVRQHQEARLLILGEGEDRPALSKLIRDLNLSEHVELPGFVDNVFACMARARVFALSSVFEGFGNVIVEALAVGTPVVATDCRSGPAEILSEGRYGDLVPVGDVGALAAAILRNLQSTPDCERLQERAKDFSTSVVAARYREVFSVAADHDTLS